MRRRSGAERLLQLEAVAVGIAREIVEHARIAALRERAHAERILVRGELDDARFVEPQLARELGDRLARLVRRDGADVAGARSHTFSIRAAWR